MPAVLANPSLSFSCTIDNSGWGGAAETAAGEGCAQEDPREVLDGGGEAEAVSESFQT